MSRLNPQFVRKARAKARASELKADHAIDKPRLVVRSPAPSPRPGYDSTGNFDGDLERLDLAQRFLHGYTVATPAGLLVRVYPSPEEERRGREALAQLLWSGECPKALLWVLASYIAPAGSELADTDFTLKIGKRRAGAMRSGEAELQVGLIVMEEMDTGKSTEDAVAVAAAYFKLEIRQVKTYWSRFKRSHLSAFKQLDQTHAEPTAE